MNSGQWMHATAWDARDQGGQPITGSTGGRSRPLPADAMDELANAEQALAVARTIL